MQKHIIARGALAGLIAGVLAYVFARIWAEPIIGRAIERQDAADAAEHAASGHDHGGDAEVFSRPIQENVGLGGGILLFGIAMGALFGVAYCVAASKFPHWTPRALALAVAGSLFAGIYVIPFLKYPPNPPGVGDPDTIGERSGTYLLMVAIALALIAVGWVAMLALSSQFGGWAAGLMGAAIVVIGSCVAYAVLPAPASSGDFPADELFVFRQYAFIAQAIVWGGIGLIGAELVHRLTVDRAPAKASVPA